MPDALRPFFHRKIYRRNRWTDRLLTVGEHDVEEIREEMLNQGLIPKGLVFLTRLSQPNGHLVLLLLNAGSKLREFDDFDASDEGQ